MEQHVFIISDGTGRTATQLLDSALVQFKGIEVIKHVRPKVRDKKQIRDIIREAFEIKGLLIHTLVSQELRHFIHDLGRLYRVLSRNDKDARKHFEKERYKACNVML